MCYTSVVLNFKPRLRKCYRSRSVFFGIILKFKFVDIYSWIHFMGIHLCADVNFFLSLSGLFFKSAEFARVNCYLYQRLLSRELRGELFLTGLTLTVDFGFFFWVIYCYDFFLLPIQWGFLPKNTAFLSSDTLMSSGLIKIILTLKFSRITSLMECKIFQLIILNLTM